MAQGGSHLAIWRGFLLGQHGTFAAQGLFDLRWGRKAGPGEVLVMFRLFSFAYFGLKAYYEVHWLAKYNFLYERE
jgi:hypothetical protein